MAHKNTTIKKKSTINCRGKLLKIDQPLVMGILNITPDSFYDGGKFTSPGNIMQQFERMLSEGADIIDIGAASTRPGAQEIPAKEEINRLTSCLSAIRKKYPDSILSVDTYRAEAAKIAVRDYEADIINDISSGEMDKSMMETIAGLNVPYIMMHMQGNPQNMQKNPVYGHVVQDIVQFFSKKVQQMNELGVNDLIIDPGFGFGKTIQHNYDLLNKLDNFKILGLPVLVGLSRKSFVYKVLGLNAKQALNGTTVLHTIALLHGANMLRVHDVKEAKEAIRLVELLN